MGRSGVTLGRSGEPLDGVNDGVNERAEASQRLHNGFTKEQGKNLGVTSGGANDGVNDGVNDSQRKILLAIMEKPSITQAELSKLVGISIVHVNKNIARLKKLGVLERMGSDRNGYWKILDRSST